MTEKILLLVEDNEDDEFLACRILRKFPVFTRIDVARDGAEALDYLSDAAPAGDPAPTRLPALILLDLKLPKMSGIEILQKIRDDIHTRDIPVIILSSSNNPQDVARCAVLGAFRYFNKPLDAALFSQTLVAMGLDGADYPIAGDDPAAAHSSVPGSL